MKTFLNGDGNNHPIQETQRVPNRINPRQNTPRHILIKLTEIKHKEQIFKAARENTTNNTQRHSHKDNCRSFNRNSSGQEGMANILKAMKENNLQPRILYTTRISFKYEGEIKSFTDKQKLREFSTTKPALQQMLKDIL